MLTYISLSLKASSFAGPSNTKVFDHFISMGFPAEVVSKVIQEYGKSIALLYLSVVY
jgi:hypothetical protein